MASLVNFLIFQFFKKNPGRGFSKTQMLQKILKNVQEAILAQFVFKTWNFTKGLAYKEPLTKCILVSVSELETQGLNGAMVGSSIFKPPWTQFSICNNQKIGAGKPTAQKMKFSIKDFFGKCDQIRKKLRIQSHLLKKSFMKNFIFCAVKQSDSKIRKP